MEPEDATAVFEGLEGREYVHEPGFGGHDFVFVDELSLGQTCSICLVAMRNPVQTMCGHRFCEDCLLRTFRQGNDRVCPQDRSPIPQDGGFFRDVAFEREILSLRVKCKKSEEGCDWIGELRHYQAHLSTCQYEDVVCYDCEEEMQRRFLNEHVTSECRNRIVQCEYCEEEFAVWRQEVHEGEECARFPLECPQKCGVQEIPREEVDSHVRDDCFMTVVVCPYEAAGCTFHDKRVKLEAHFDKSCEDHLRKTWSELLKAKKKLSELEKIIVPVEILQTEKDSIQRSLEEHSKEICDLKLSEKKLELENMRLRNDMAELGRKLAQLELKEDRSLFQTLQTQNMTLRKELTEMGRQLGELKLTAANQKRERNSLQQPRKEVTEMHEKFRAAIEKKNSDVEKRGIFDSAKEEVEEEDLSSVLYVGGSPQGKVDREVWQEDDDRRSPKKEEDDKWSVAATCGRRVRPVSRSTTVSFKQLRLNRKFIPKKE